LQGAHYTLAALHDSLTGGRDRHFWNLDIPAMAGYSWGRGNFSVDVHGGVIVNLHSWSGPALVRYERNTGLSYYLGCSLSERLGNSPYSLFIEPYYRRPLSYSSAITAPLRGFNVAGLSVGIAVGFYQIKFKR
jgi:hypothetical protein